MKRFGKLITVFTFSLLVLGMVTIASAQSRKDDDENDDYYGRDRNGQYGRNDQTGTYNNGQIRSAIERLKNRSKRFDKQLDREFNRGRRGNDRYYQSRILQISENFKDAASDLEDSFDNGRGRYDRNRNSGSYEAQQLINLGQQLGREVRNQRLSSNLENDWYSMEQDLRIIANYYGYNYGGRNNGRGRNRNGGYNNGDWRSKVPFPLPF